MTARFVWLGFAVLAALMLVIPVASMLGSVR